MNAEQVKEILERVKANRPSFELTTPVHKEWYRVLKNYDFDDVDKKIDEYFSEPTNFGRYPDAHYITRFLKTKDEKLNTHIIKKVYCNECKKAVDYVNYKEHKERCDSIRYLKEESKEILNSEITEQDIKLFESMNDEQFKNVYNQYLKRFWNTDNELKKRLIKNVILTGKGLEPEYTVNELLRQM